MLTNIDWSMLPCVSIGLGKHILEIMKSLFKGSKKSNKWDTLKLIDADPLELGRL